MFRVTARLAGHQMAGYHDLETMCCMEDHHFKVRDRRIGPGSPQADQGNPTGHPNDKPSMVYKMSQIEISSVYQDHLAVVVYGQTR